MTEPNVYRMADHKTWGNRIGWFRIPDANGSGTIHGWLQRRPQPGDRIICPMQSGKDAIFEVQAEGNSYLWDPPDQFFVNVAFGGYVAEGSSP